MAEEENCMNLRLLINKKTRRILYAEAGKDLVDALFSFLLLPTGAVIKLLADNKYPDTVGCLTNLYNSVDNLQPRYMSGDKSELLHPKIGRAPNNFFINMLPIEAPSESTPVTAKYYVCRDLSNMPTRSSGFSAASLPSFSSSSSLCSAAFYPSFSSSSFGCSAASYPSCPSSSFGRSAASYPSFSSFSFSSFGCSSASYPSSSFSSGCSSASYSSSHNITNQYGHTCSCGSTMNIELQLKNPVETVSATKHSGYVKETVAFIITDDLSISPTSPITSITMLNKLNADLTDLEERNVTVSTKKVNSFCLVSSYFYSFCLCVDIVLFLFSNVIFQQQKLLFLTIVGSASGGYGFEDSSK
eukprot:Gb_26022 [translate_table: standard]